MGIKHHAEQSVGTMQMKKPCSKEQWSVSWLDGKNKAETEEFQAPGSYTKVAPTQQYRLPDSNSTAGENLSAEEGKERKKEARFRHWTIS